MDKIAGSRQQCRVRLSSRFFFGSDIMQSDKGNNVIRKCYELTV